MEAAPLSQSTATSPGLGSRWSLLSGSVALAGGGALRMWMLHKFFEVNGDSQLYGGLAKNLLLQGRYGLSDGSGMLHSTLIRLPGYPLFLAACFRLFGMENYFAAACVQILLEMVGCALLALFAQRISPQGRKSAAFHATLWLAALCPFTAIYAAEPLTEGPTVFAIALALWAAARFQDEPGWGPALAFTFAVTFAALLRPDGALVGVALAPAMVFAIAGSGLGAMAARRTEDSEASSTGKRRNVRAKALAYQGPQGLLSGEGSRIVPALKVMRMALVCVLLALAPFVAWTWRNWRVFHVFQPLAPRYATDPGENTWPGWQRWVKTWSLDFVSTYQIYWNMPGAELNAGQLPSRAFDTPAQAAETATLFKDYEANGEEMSPPLDDRFVQLAEERIAAHPLRYYVWLPLGRMADMWVRPRVENLPIDLDWWVYSHHRAETRFSWAYAGLNAAYLLLAAVGLWLRPRMWPWMLAYMVLRSLLLCTVEAPEARYTIECFPMLFALGGVAFAKALSLRPVARSR